MAKKPTGDENKPVKHQQKFEIVSGQTTNVEKGANKSIVTETSIVPSPLGQPARQSINFANPEELRRWLGTQPREVGIALAARSALRVLPMIGLPQAGGGPQVLTLADGSIVQAAFRALAVAWIGGGLYAGPKALTTVARATLAAAAGLPIGTIAITPAASAPRVSAVETVRAVALTGQPKSVSVNALASAINTAFSAEAGEADARGVAAFAEDVALLDTLLPRLLGGTVPLWPNGAPAWVEPRWRDMKALLLDLRQDWQVWTTWYDDRLDGRLRSTERELAYVEVPDDLWTQGSAAVNADIIKRIEEHEPPPEPIFPYDDAPEVQPPATPEKEGAPEFSDPRDVERWLADKPPDWASVIAARSALRGIPALTGEARALSGSGETDENTIILPVFRAVCAAWVAAINQSWRNNSGLAAGIDAAEKATFAFERSARTNSITAAKAAISTVTTNTDGPRGAGAGWVAAAAAAASAMAAIDDRKAASKAVWTITADDGRILEHPIVPSDVAHHPLWPGGAPDWWFGAWRQLKGELLRSNSDWEVWTSWFEDRLNGGPVSQKIEIARVSIAETLWQQGPRAVNAEITRLIETFQDREIFEYATAPANWNFFLSYSNEDQAFAQWVENVLTAAGLKVFSQFNNMPPGSNFVREMQRGLERSGRLIALLSPAYVKSHHCQAEWSAAYSADPVGDARKLVLLLIEAAELPHLAKQIVYKQLIGLSASDAAEAVLEAVGYRGPVHSTLPTSWPGRAAIDRMTAATGGIFDVRPGDDLRLEPVPAALAEPDDKAFTPKQLFENSVAVIADFFEFTKRSAGNYRCSQRLRERAAKLYQASSIEFSSIDPLAINSRLVWVLRVMTLDRDDGLIPRNDEFEFHQRDLYGVYNQLERIFPKLKLYRKMVARDRFEQPSADAEEAISSIYRSFGDPNISESALSPDLSQELKQAGESIEEARAATTDQRSDITVESHTDAATRSLAVWSWLSNAQDKLVNSGKKADEVAKAVERYDKLYATLSPLMVRYMGYLVRWFF